MTWRTFWRFALAVALGTSIGQVAVRLVAGRWWWP